MGHGPKRTALESEQMERRREAVASLRLRRMTVLQITEALPKMGVVSPDGTPWSRATVGNDLKAIKEEWKERACESFDAHVAEMMASLDEIEAAAWEQQNLDALLRSHDRRAKLLGLDRPQRKELSGPNGGPVPLLNIAPEKASEVLARLGYLDPEDDAESDS